ncbi:short-chain dehydrogenase [Gammaproteobacteria bacterium 45_16_T64]|nr:short-chain dehydrogenase [Gammaproteobacteria bacterium 45_16_T64]
MNADKLQKTAIITGASSGIGKALAFEMAQKGYNLGLVSRRLEALEQVRTDIKQQCSNNINIEIETLDVAEDHTILPVLEKLSNTLGGTDIIVANAGITAVNRTGTGNFSVDRNVIQINLIGAMATVDAAAALFRKQKKGHIVGISSVTAWVGIPGSSAYSSSKAGFTTYLQAVRGELRKKNIQVTTIHPGFIDTDIAENMGSKPFVISAKKAAGQMLSAIEKKKSSVIVPNLPWSVVTKLITLLPEKIVARAL